MFEISALVQSALDVFPGTSMCDSHLGEVVRQPSAGLENESYLGCSIMN